MVAATVSWRAGWVRPRRAVQRARLCASTQQASQAPLAGNRPEGQRLSPALSLRSLNGEFDCGVVSRWYASAALVSRSCSVGDEAVVAPVGPQLALGAKQAGAAHDEAQLGGFAVVAAQLVAAAAGFDGGLSHLGLAAAGVGDRLARRPRRWPRRLL